MGVSQKKNRVVIFVVLLAIAIIIAVSALIVMKNRNKNELSNTVQTPSSQVDPLKASDADTAITIVATGDLLPHDSVNANAKTADSGYNYVQFFDKLTPYFKNNDIVFCNQESTTAGDLPITGYPTFNAPIAFSRDINAVGCNVVNLANNHMADYGQAGITGTLATWANLPNKLAINGVNNNANEQQVSYFTVKGKKIGFVSFTYLSNNKNVADYALNTFNDSLVQKLVGEADKNADFVIVSAHWGTEGDANPDTGEKEWAQKLIANGADLVIGTGPHILQPVETITAGGKTGTVWYSLGNLLSTQLKSHELIGGLGRISIDTKDNAMKISNMSFVPTYMHYEWSPADQQAENLSARKNLMLYPLWDAESPMQTARFGMTKEQAFAHVNSTINKNNNVTVITSQQ